nr:tubulin-folding cofactor C [Tanacetum cinerariifolium]
MRRLHSGGLVASVFSGSSGAGVSVRSSMLEFGARAQKGRKDDSQASDLNYCFETPTSRPIIEQSSGFSFAPYCLCYDGIDSDLKGSNIYDDDTGSWEKVDDFLFYLFVCSSHSVALHGKVSLGGIDTETQWAGSRCVEAQAAITPAISVTAAILCTYYSSTYKEYLEAYGRGSGISHQPMRPPPPPHPPE